MDRERLRTLRWPIAIAVGLGLVVLAELVFIYIAVSGQDEIVPTYHSERR